MTPPAGIHALMHLNMKDTGAGAQCARLTVRVVRVNAPGRWLNSTPARVRRPELRQIYRGGGCNSCSSRLLCRYASLAPWPGCEVRIGKCEVRMFFYSTHPASMLGDQMLSMSESSSAKIGRLLAKAAAHSRTAVPCAWKALWLQLLPLLFHGPCMHKHSMRRVCTHVRGRHAEVCMGTSLGIVARCVLIAIRDDKRTLSRPLCRPLPHAV